MKSDQLLSQPSLVKKNKSVQPEDMKVSSLHLQNVNATYYEGAFSDISLQLKAGRVYGFLGNIAKRKLLLNLISGTVQPSAGQLLVNDTTDISTISHWSSSYVTKIEKENHIFSKGDSNQADPDNGIATKKTTLFNGVVNTLLETAPVLMLDEAMALLTIETEERIMQQICLQNQHNIVILNTTRPSSLKYCDHIFLLKHNRITEISKQTYFTDFASIFSGFFKDYYMENML